MRVCCYVLCTVCMFVQTTLRAYLDLHRNARLHAPAEVVRKRAFGVVPVPSCVVLTHARLLAARIHDDEFRVGHVLRSVVSRHHLHTSDVECLWKTNLLLVRRLIYND